MVRKLLLNRSKNRQVQLKLVGFIFTENSNTVQKHRDLKHSQKQVLQVVLGCLKCNGFLVLLLTVQDYFIFKASYIQRNSFSVSDIFFELSFTSICISGVKSNSLSPW